MCCIRLLYDYSLYVCARTHHREVDERGSAYNVNVFRHSSGVELVNQLGERLAAAVALPVTANEEPSVRGVELYLEGYIWVLEGESNL